MTLAGKTALVTGGSRGIGRAICLRLAVQGANVGINYVSRAAAAEEVLAEITAAGGKGFVIGFDVADSAAVQNAVKTISADHGVVDILINNAGITRDGLMARMKDEDWDAVLNTNLKGAFVCSKEAMRGMMKKRWGRIINISSVVGATGNPGQGNYAAAKAGVIGMSKSLAYEVASRGITVNAVAPGFIATAMTDKLTADQKTAILGNVPAGRMGEPSEIAAAVLYLASPEAGYTTGTVLHVNGGLAMI